MCSVLRSAIVVCNGATDKGCRHKKELQRYAYRRKHRDRSARRGRLCLHLRREPLASMGWHYYRGEGRPRRPSTRWRNLRSEEHTSELQSRQYLVCRLLLEKKK